MSTTTVTRRRAAALIAAAPLLMIGATGCSFGVKKKDDDNSADSQNKDGDGQGSDGQSGGNAGNYPEPILTTKCPATVEDDPGATFTVNLHQLKKEGETVTIYVSFTLNSTTKKTENMWTLNNRSNWHPHLVDTKNMRLHEPLTSKNHGAKALTDLFETSMTGGDTVYAFATFAAPPADVTHMDVSIIDGAEVAKGVEIQ